MKLTLSFFRTACHQFVTCHSYVLVCHSYVTRMYSYIIRISLICTCMSSVCHSYELVYHLYLIHMYLYVIRMSLVCTRMLSLSHSYIIRMSLVCGFAMNHEKCFMPFLLNIKIVVLESLPLDNCPQTIPTQNNCHPNNSNLG